LPSNIRALQLTSLEAVFSCLLLRLGRKVSRGQEFVDESLVLANAVTEHAAVITIGIETPLYIDYITSLVGNDGLCTPARTGLVVIDGDTSVVSART
jgi:hypothetical protein